MSNDSSDDKGGSPQQTLQDYVDLMFMDDSFKRTNTEFADKTDHQAKIQSGRNADSIFRSTEQSSKDNQACKLAQPAETNIIRTAEPVSTPRSDTVLTRPANSASSSTSTSTSTSRPVAHGKPVKEFDEDAVDWQLIRDRVKKLTQRLPEPAKKETTHAPPPVKESIGSSLKPPVSSAMSESQTEQKARRHIAQTQKKKETLVSVFSSTDQESSTSLVDNKLVESKSADSKTGEKQNAQALKPGVLDAGAGSANDWCENGRPAWAQEEFECLLFKVSGLTMAVPLVELGSIYPVNDELTPIFGQVDWFVGLLPINHTNIRVVNTAKVVMPERYNPSFLESFHYVISINGYDWGLAVDCVDKAITLEPAAVRWRTMRSKRPWLAGTVVDYMCALVDVQTMAAMFDRAD